MSGVVVIPNQFAAAVTATAGAIDVNFNSVTAYINDPTNRNNYVADSSGATNTVNLTFSPPVVGGYTTGLEMTWKWGATNTGAVVVNANSLGNINVVNPDGTALQQGQGKAGSIGKAVYDGTRAIYISQSAQRAGEAKAWAIFQGTVTGTVTALSAFNVASIVRLGTGTYSISFTNQFSSGNYVVTGAGSSNTMLNTTSGTRTTAGVTVQIFTTAGSAADPGEVNFVAHGVSA